MPGAQLWVCRRFMWPISLPQGADKGSKGRYKHRRPTAAQSDAGRFESQNAPDCRDCGTLRRESLWTT
jgi:hypothetical protein